MQQYRLADPTMISARAFDDEVVIANFATGIYYSLQHAAAEIWLGLMAGVPANTVISEVAQHSRAGAPEFADAAWELVRALEAERLIAPAAGAVDASWQPRRPDEPFGAPFLERFSDMEELLLLDPIHDLGRTGWPDVLRKQVD